MQGKQNSQLTISQRLLSTFADLHLLRKYLDSFFNLKGYMLRMAYQGPNSKSNSVETKHCSQITVAFVTWLGMRMSLHNFNFMSN